MSPTPGTLYALSDADNGRTISVVAADRLQVTLASTYWTFGPPSDAGVLVAQGPQQTAPCPTRTIPGSGCGTATVVYAAQTPGTSVIAADRVSCGEALQCTGNQGTYRVTIVVRAG